MAVCCWDRFIYLHELYQDILRYVVFVWFTRGFCGICPSRLNHAQFERERYTDE